MFGIHIYVIFDSKLCQCNQCTLHNGMQKEYFWFKLKDVYALVTMKIWVCVASFWIKVQSVHSLYLHSYKYTMVSFIAHQWVKVIVRLVFFHRRTHNICTLKQKKKWTKVWQLQLNHVVSQYGNAHSNTEKLCWTIWEMLYNAKLMAVLVIQSSWQ